MTSFDQLDCNSHSCEPTNAVYTHETLIRLTQPYFKFSEKTVLHEPNEMRLSKTILLLSTTTTVTEPNFVQPMNLREPVNLC